MNSRNPVTALFKRSIMGTAVYLSLLLFAQSALAQIADLAVNLSSSAEPVLAGSGPGNLTLTGTVTNQGPGDASNVVGSLFFLPSSLPAGVMIDGIAVSTGIFDPDSGGWNIGALANGQSETITATLTIAADAPQTMDCASEPFHDCLATVLAVAELAETDPSPENDSAFLKATFYREVDVGITLLQTTDSVVAGSGTGNLVYVGVVTNAGPSEASGLVNMTQTHFPDGVSVDLLAVGQGSYDGETGLWDLGALAPGASAQIAVTYTVAAEAVAGVDIIDASMSVSLLNETDINSSNDSATLATTVLNAIDLGVSLRESGDPVTAGSGARNLAFEGTLTNAGPSLARGVSVLAQTESLDGVSVDRVIVSQGGFDDNTGLWDIETLTPGGFAKIVITYTVEADAPAGADIIATSLSVSAAGAADFNPENDHVAITTSVDRFSDLSITQFDAGGSGPIVAGTHFSYFIDLWNAGPSDSANSKLIVELPAQVNYISDSFGCSEGPHGRLTCDGADFPVNAQFQIAFEVAAGSNLAVGEELFGEAFISGDSIDPKPQNNSATEVNVVDRLSDLAIWVTDDPGPDPVVAGTELTYTIGVSNDGPSDADNVQVVSLLPPGTSFLSTSLSVGCIESPAGILNCALGDRGADVGVFNEFEVVLLVDEQVPDNTLLTHEVSVSSDSTDPVPENNRFILTDATTVVAPETDLVSVIVRHRFMDGNPVTPVTFHLSCNNGLPLEQQITVVPDAVDFDRDSSEVRFVVTRLSPGRMNCTAYTDTVPGYTPSYACGSIVNPATFCSDGGDSSLDDFGAGPCVFENTESTDVDAVGNSCTIRNYPNPGLLVITKDWVVDGTAANVPDMLAHVELRSSAYVEGARECGTEEWCRTVVFEGGPASEARSLEVEASYLGTTVTLVEDVFDSAFESDNNCEGTVTIYPMGYHGQDGTYHCKFTNTAYFEGIPVLNSPGKTILFLLLMGIGLVRLRQTTM